LIHLLILALPPLGIAYTVLSGSQPRAAWESFNTASNACLWIGTALIFISLGMGFVIKRKPFNERAVERQLTTTVVGFELVVDSFSLLMALASPVAGLLISAGAAVWLIFWSQSRLRALTLASDYVVLRSPEVVFAFVSDFRNEPRYYPDVESVEMLTAPPVGPGTQFRSRVRLPDGREAVGVEEIVDYEPNRRFTSRIAATSRANIDAFTFEPVEIGTRVTHRFDFELSLAGAVLGGRFTQSVANRLLTLRRDAGEIRLKQILESDEFDR